jgi:hypothetical protein
MADTRINALSTATSSVGDDFVPIDGTTNGTRKLSAFSPSFGGNATVGGTLTVSGSSNSTVAGNVVGSKAILATGNIGSPGSTGLTAFIDVDTGNSVSRVGSYNFTTSAWSELQINGGGGNVKVGNPSSVLTVNGTTASTTTSTGALVVSGGVGVAGAMWVGGTNSNIVHATNPTFNLYEASTLTASLQTFSGDVYLQASTTKDIIFRTSGSTEMGRWTGATKALSVLSTTASTSTSSGALVVSGGVGVAKEMYLGGGLLNVAKGGAGATIEINADSGFASKLAMQRAATNRWTLEVDSSDVLTLKSLGTTAALTMTGTTSAEFVGSIKTAAPSGGTAANWKLGTVASVSPTSPNRTIEVDIGGTIYYIHAKTTNN